MQRLQHDYLAAYRSLKLTRDSEGVLVAEFHSNDGPFTFTAQDHTEFVDAFYRIAQDRANKIVILTRAGGEFTPDFDFRFSATSPIRAFGARFTTRAFRAIPDSSEPRIRGKGWSSTLPSRMRRRPNCPPLPPLRVLAVVQRWVPVEVGRRM